MNSEVDSLTSGEIRELCDQALREPYLAELERKLVRQSCSPADLVNAVRLVGTRGERRDLQTLRSLAGPTDAPAAHAGLERLCLIRAALASLGQLESLPVDESVKQRILDEFRFFAAPGKKDLTLFDPDGRAFVSFCRIACFRRFPAGQFHWERSGFPRSWLLKVPPRDLPGLLRYLWMRSKGFAPWVEPHLNARRSSRTFLIERESYRSYHRIARSIERQPEVRGLAAFSWLHSPEIPRVSPHLSWINRVFLEHGGFVTTVGKAKPEAGFLGGSPERQRLYESGDWKPTIGCALWAREAMIRWAHQHPEFAS